MTTRLMLGAGALLCLTGLGLTALVPGTCDTGELATTAAPPSFLSSLAAPPAPFVGHTLEVIHVEGYTYHLVVPTQGEDVETAVWVVTLARDARVRERISVRPYGKATRFRSGQTDRTFETLLFSSVKPAGAPS